MINIRRAKLKDLNLILNFEKKLLNSAVKIMTIHTPQHLNDINLKQNFEELLLKYIKGRIYSKNDAIFISEFNDKPVGHMIISVKKSFPIFDLQFYGRINTVFVEEEFRGRGISSKLKNEAIKWFKSKGIERISLNVFPNNKTAIDVYNRWGLTLSLFEMRMTI